MLILQYSYINQKIYRHKLHYIINQNNAAYYNKGYAAGVAESVSSSKIKYLYHMHSAECVETSDAYINVLSNDGTFCTYVYQYNNKNYSKYPSSQAISNNYVLNGGENFPQGHYALSHKIYFCNVGSQESINADNLTGKEDPSIIEGAMISFDP